MGVSLIACNAHEYFTQDIEDIIEGAFEEINGQKPQSEKPATPAKLKPREEIKSEKEPTPVSSQKERNVIQIFWDAVKSYGIDRETGIQISQEAGLDFALALDKLNADYAKEGTSNISTGTGQEKLGI